MHSVASYAGWYLPKMQSVHEWEPQILLSRKPETSHGWFRL